MNQENMNNTMPDLGTAYPEIFYKVQPYIIMMCDQLDSYYGDTMPNQEMMDQMTESIYRDLVEMNPDIEEYARNYENQQAQPTVVEMRSRFPEFHRRRFRRRGLLRDLIDILFLSELFRRRRRY